MKPGPTAVMALFGVCGVLVGLGVALNVYWAGAKFPPWLFALDAILVLLVVTLSGWALGYYSRHKAALTDEFAVSRKRESVATGAFIGALIYVAMSLAFSAMPEWEAVLLTAFHMQGEAFAMGRLVGILPICVGVLIGHIYVWSKYR